MKRHRKKDSKEIRVCYKCGASRNMSFHHFYPNAKWHESPKGKYLCMDCHKAFHEFAGWETYKRPNIKYKLWYFITFVKWIAGITLIYLLWMSFIK